LESNTQPQKEVSLEQTTKIASVFEIFKVEWFVAAVGLIYGCGFLVVFTFLKDFGIESVDFVEAKYIHVGFLFFLACLVIIVPIWWLLWPLKDQMPEHFAKRIQTGLLQTTWRKRLEYFFVAPIKKVYFPDWEFNKDHGIHAGWAVRLSMIFILWAFIIITMFAQPHFGHEHPKLLILNFPCSRVS